MSMSKLAVRALCFICMLGNTAVAMNPIEVKGYKLFDSVTGKEVTIRGIDYYPRPNHGDLNRNSVDYFTNEHRHIWERDLPYLKELGVNAIRLYAVDSENNHDAFMCATQAAGIYVIVALAHDCPTCAVTRDAAPDCYPPDLKTQGQAVIREFSKYPNLLAFSAGNEVNHFAPSGFPEWNGPCQKKFLRDMREYIASCPTLRKVPVGLVAADSDRDDNAMYYNCQSDPNDPYENAEWYGLNSYVVCDGKATSYEQATGFRLLQQSFANYSYSIPVLLTEFGCLSKSFPTLRGYQAQRTFFQAKWLLEEPDLRDQFQGGFVFEYSIEYENAHIESPYPFRRRGAQNYGVGYFGPEKCDDIKSPCAYHPLPSFDNLKTAYDTNSTKSSVIALMKDSFEVPSHRQGRTPCPSRFPALSDFVWEADSLESKACPSAQEATFMCPANWDDLIYHDNEKPESSEISPWMIPVAVLAGVLMSFACLAWIVAVQRRSTTLGQDEKTPSPLSWITVAISQYKDDKDDGDSRSDESTGLLSMKNMDSGVAYKAIESDSSFEDLVRVASSHSSG